MTPPNLPNPPTPALDRLLARLRGRVSAQVWLHGLGTVAVVAAGWFLFEFALDWWLHLPAAIRIFHLFVLLALPAVILWRELVKPLAKMPDEAGLAVLVERAHAELKELLVSAVQFKSSARASGDPTFVASVLRDAESASGHLSLEGVLDPRGPRRRFLCGLLAFTFTAGVLVWNASSAAVFLARIAGGDTPWPQRTHLFLEVKLADSRLTAAHTESFDPHADTVVRVARGTDIPVVVRAEGVVPEEVTLHFQDGHKIVLAAAGGPTFHALLRSVQEDMELFATGGDDVDDHPRVKLVVLQPPDVAGLAVEIAPPEYSQLPARIEHDRDVEVLAGSKLVVHVLTDPPGAKGHARLLPEDRVLELSAAPFPQISNADPKLTESKGAAPKSGLAFALQPEKSLRYRIELTDDTGLSNPDPGLFGITVVEDRTPEVEVLSPGRGDVDTVPGGLIALRARAEDDFGIARMNLIVDLGGAQPRIEKTASDKPDSRELAWAPVAPSGANSIGVAEARAESASASDKNPVGARPIVRATAIARQRLEVATLGGHEPLTEGTQLQLVVTATDNCATKAHEGRSSPIRVRIVSPDEFLRRLQDRLSRAQTSTSALAELQREKSHRAAELLATLESDAPEGGSQGELAAALTGERRVQGDARALARELAAAAESVLYTRLDERALAALETIDARLQASTVRGFDPAPWRELAQASRDASVAGTGLCGKLIDITGLALEISEDATGSAVDDLARAADAVELKKAHDHLKSAVENQKKALAKIETLLEKLAEWDNFQSVLTLTRDILNGQKSLRERTRQAAKDK